jgi:hypothetical protein
MRKHLLRIMRKWRKRAFVFGILAGDIIALLKGPAAYARRWVRKKLLKHAGKRIKRATGR